MHTKPKRWIGLVFRPVEAESQAIVVIGHQTVVEVAMAHYKPPVKTFMAGRSEQFFARRITAS